MIQLDLADIQGNIHRPYGRFGFPFTRHLFFNILCAREGRALWMLAHDTGLRSTRSTFETSRHTAPSAPDVAARMTMSP